METAWLFEKLAITVARIDFLDPALIDEADARERGVRLEVRLLQSTRRGSVYASSTEVLEPAICRIDLLESQPHAADRMHWHPTMDQGEPGDRVMEAGIGADPLGWLDARLTAFDGLLALAGVDDVAAMTGDVESIRAAAGEIGACVADGLAWARESPWPAVVHDERGLAPIR